MKSVAQKFNVSHTTISKILKAFKSSNHDNLSQNDNNEVDHKESEGYIVDVFENCIILNGRDFVGNDNDGHWLPIATYKIDTTVQIIEPNSFTDPTGTIK